MIDSIKNFRYDNYKPKTKRDHLANAVAGLGISPDDKVMITNLLTQFEGTPEDKYKYAVELLGQMRADKIKIYL